MAAFMSHGRTMPVNLSALQLTGSNEDSFFKPNHEGFTINCSMRQEEISLESITS